MSLESSQSKNGCVESTQPPATGVGSRLLKLPQVLEKIPVSRTEWYRRIKAGLAPAPIALGVRAVAWRESDIDSYINTLAKGGN